MRERDERVRENNAVANAVRVANQHLTREINADEKGALDRFVRDVASSMRAAARPAGDGRERGSLAQPEHVEDGTDAMHRDHVDVIVRARDRVRACISECARFCGDLDLPRLDPVAGDAGPGASDEQLRAIRDAVAAADARARALSAVLHEVEAVAHYVQLRGPEPVGRRAVTRKAAAILWNYVDLLDIEAPGSCASMTFPYYSLPRGAARRIVDAAGRAGFPELSRTWHESRGQD